MRYLNTSIERYLRDLASDKPAPGGGSAAALAASLGVSLLLMVANFTRGKKYKKAEETIKKVINELSKNKKNLDSLIDKDIEAYKKVGRAIRLPKGEKRERLLEVSLKNALKAPLDVCRMSNDSLEKVPILFKKGNRNLLTDVRCGRLLLKSAYAAAKVNIEINLRCIKDKNFVNRTRRRLEQWQYC